MLKYLLNKGKIKMAKSKILVNSGISVAMAVASVVAIAVQVQQQPSVSARTADEIGVEIQQLQEEIEKAQQQASELKAKSETLQNELNTVAAQRTVIEHQIKATQSQYEKLLIEIKETEENIEKNRKTLGSLLAKMSIEDDLSPIERIASSENISTALDDFEYQSAIKTKLANQVKEIKEQKEALETKRDQVAQNLEDQKSFEGELQAKIAEQNKLIEIAKSEAAEYTAYAESRSAEKEQLQQEQQAIFEEAARRAAEAAAAAAAAAGNSAAAANVSVPVAVSAASSYDQDWGAGCWVDAANDSWGGPRGDGTDPYGYYCGQCVSYTAWKLMKMGITAKWWGDAKMWPANARAEGWSTGSEPRANSVGVIMSGYWGHVVWVDSVNADGTINISQYNYHARGAYSEMYNVHPSMYDTYIYFD